MFEKVEDVDDWTHIMYNGQDGYMKTEFLTEISEEEYNQGPTEETAETKTEEKKEEKKTEEANNNENTENTEGQTQTKEEAEAKAKADAEKQAAEELQKQQEALAAAAAAAAAMGHSVTMKDGVTVNFTNSQYEYLKGIWASDTDEMISHHTSGEIKSLVEGR